MSEIPDIGKAGRKLALALDDFRDAGGDSSRVAVAVEMLIHAAMYANMPRAHESIMGIPVRADENATIGYVFAEVDGNPVAAVKLPPPDSDSLVARLREAASGDARDFRVGGTERTIEALEKLAGEAAARIEELERERTNVAED